MADTLYIFYFKSPAASDRAQKRRSKSNLFDFFDSYFSHVHLSCLCVFSKCLLFVKKCR